MELALAALLVSSLTCVGLLALWAATSPRHWFLRTGVFVGVISLLLLIPAYEPLVAFALQGTVVAAGVQLARRRRSASSDSPAKTQYSLATLLQAIVFVAIAAAVAAKLPALNLEAWQSVVIIGCVGGLATLTGFWMRHGSNTRWVTRVLIGILLTLLLCVPLLFGDWFVVAVIDSFGWPPDKLWWTSTARRTSPVWIWPLVTSAIVCLTVLSVWLVALLTTGFASTGGSAGRRPIWRWAAACIVLVLGCCLTLPSAVVYYQLANPLPIPVEALPEPNGYDDFKAAWAMLGTNLLVESANFDAKTSPVTQLRTAVNQVLPALDRARKGLTCPAMRQIDYSFGAELEMEELQNMRAFARAFVAQGNLSIREQDFAGAMTTFLDLIDYGIAARRGGLIVDGLVGVACSGVGRSDLFHLRTQLTAEQCRRAIERLTTELTNVEPHEQFEHRDRVWTQQALGWFGNLSQYLPDLTGDYRYADPADYGKLFLREQAEMRLLVVELALQAYLLEHNQLPSQLTDLVPEYLPDVPVDPLSQDSSQLAYRRTDDGYLLYSVGYNGIDEGGATPEDEESYLDLNQETDDLRLDVMYAPYEEETEDDTSMKENVPVEAQQ